MVSRAALVVPILGTVLGCGTALHVTSVPYGADTTARLRRGAHGLGCTERASEVFELFLVCPPHDQAIGVSCSEGKVSLTCPGLWPRNCVNLLERLNQAGGKKGAGEMAK